MAMLADQGRAPSGISFVASGTGGLVVRAALPWLSEHSDKFRTCMTLCTPHLGLWLQGLSWPLWLRLFFRSLVARSPLWLHQLTLSEGRKGWGSRLHRLSEFEGNGLGRFARLIFVATPDDALVPLTSAWACLSASDVKEAASAPELACKTAGPAALTGAGKPSANKKILVILLPVMWLLRLRAFRSLALLLFLAVLILLLPSPPGLLGYRINWLKEGVADFIKLVRGRDDENLNVLMTANLEKSIRPERLLRVEMCFPTDKCRKSTGLLARGCGTELLQNPEALKVVARTYGNLLTADDAGKPSDRS
eukprot:TRINITY_DN41982_c0_g1_i1.p1 TRINITY_DN41982_c0_g1~~TRINITY_DN41982_c0_g1_i1.p1  ORF type:complete len:351 (-),score=52.25 TRINITY_DN41982_c0_g1_i1:26-949(-)